MNKQLLNTFFEQLALKDAFQKKYIANWEEKYEGNELEDFCQLLSFYIDVEHKTMDEIIDGYMFINNMVKEEQYFFVNNGRYRYSKFSEVDDAVYGNAKYMSRYMLGLTISDYVWIQHMKMVRFFESAFLPEAGGEYLEIGPGYGQYTKRALKSGKFEKVLACDLSAESVRGCKAFLQYQEDFNEKGTSWDILHMDFNDFEENKYFDTIVMGEVLEHVENPLQILKSIKKHLSENGRAFITTVINAPALDHIYLFSTIEEVKQLVYDAGLDIEDYVTFAAGDMAIEKAEAKKRTIDIALIVK